MMKLQFFAIFVIISLILVIPTAASAQEINIGKKAVQKSVEVIINESGNIHARHVIASSNSPQQLELIDGTIQNLIMTDEDGDKQPVTRISGNNAVMILPSNSNSIIEYDLEDVLLEKNNFWTLDFKYLESTTFILPEKADLIFVNNNPVELGDKRGLKCHGCQMTLEYSFDQQKILKKVKWENKEFVVEIITFAEIENFDFDQPTKKISFDVKEENQFITTVIPLELLWNPYSIFLDDSKIPQREHINNGTHVWLNMKPETTGEIVIIGTTAIPEFPIIAPLAIGFIIILTIPLMRKFSLR